MIKVSTNSVEDGLMPAEKIARIEVIGGGIEEVSVSVNDISHDNKLMASEIGRREGKVLVELPRESASGRWRIWVDAAAVGA
jgi:hypothetical protein